MLRACSRVRPRVSRRRSTLEEIGHGRHQAASGTAFSSIAPSSSTIAAPTRSAVSLLVRAGLSRTNDEINSRSWSCDGSDDREGNRPWWEDFSAGEEGASSIAGAVLAVAALAGLCGVVGREDRRRVLQESGPVPGGPIFGEGDEDDSFQRFPSSNRVHHAIKLARQNTSRERRRYYQYVIVGAGTTSKAAIEAILSEDPQADILLLTDEVCLPAGDVYRRDRPLPHDLLGAYNEWRRHVSARLENEPKAFSSVPMTLLLGRKRLRLDPQRRSLVLDDGIEVFFDKCLLATAGKPRQFYVLDSEKSAYLLRGRINTLGSLADFESLDLIGPSLGCREVAVVGGGFLGTEVSLAMANRGMKVWQVYAEAAPLSRHLPLYLADYVKRKLQLHGVEPVAERLVTDVRGGEDSDDMDLEKITLSMMGLSKESITSDYLVMASTHVDPVVDVARDSGLEIDPVNGGVVVNGQLEAVSGIYAAGACASYYDQALGRRRADILEHGERSGWIAGYNMAVTSLAARHGREEAEEVLRRRIEEEDDCAEDEDISGTSPGARPAAASASSKKLKYPCMYREQPAFKSRLSDLDITVDGVGEIDSRTRTVGVWVEGTEAGQNEEEARARAAEGGVPAVVPLVSGSGTDAVLPGMPHQFGRGIVYYLHGSQVVGIVLWNASDLVDKARDIITNQPAISSVEELKTLIALAPDDWIRLVETTALAPPLKRRRAR